MDFAFEEKMRKICSLRETLFRMSKKRKLDIDRDELMKKAKKFFEEKSENLATKPFTKYFEDEKFCSIHIRDSEADSFREIFGRILCEHPNCRNKSFKSRVS